MTHGRSQFVRQGYVTYQVDLAAVAALVRHEALHPLHRAPERVSRQQRDDVLRVHGLQNAYACAVVGKGLEVCVGPREAVQHVEDRATLGDCVSRGQHTDDVSQHELKLLGRDRRVSRALNAPNVFRQVPIDFLSDIER